MAALRSTRRRIRHVLGLRVYAGCSLLPCIWERRCVRGSRDAPIDKILSGLRCTPGLFTPHRRSFLANPGRRLSVLRHGLARTPKPSTSRDFDVRGWRTLAYIKAGVRRSQIPSSRVFSSTRHHQSLRRLLHDPSFSHPRIRHVSLHHAPLHLRARGCRVCFAGRHQRHRHREALPYRSCKFLPPTYSMMQCSYKSVP